MARVMGGSLIFENDLLAKLPKSELERLTAHLRLIEVAKEQILYNSGERIKHIYFPEDSLISLMARTEETQFLEVSAAGSNGIIGIPAILRAPGTPFRAIVQLPGKVWRIRAEVLKAEFDRCEKLQDVLLRYLQVFITQLSQSAVCNRFHKIEERFSRWLLACRYGIKKDELHLTHQAIALLLGVPRTLITMTANKLQRAGIINYQRGRITILDQEGLEEVACECHRIVKGESAKLLGKT